ncbi:uncharacterized protein LOC117829333 [Notolabrus celidotus]|uniref:uncharacterized protein LOC117829333 n=1 Tax=Notolabrus celidotus TaxID=1203425 RepID=UPI00148F5484|nr:uncharacterized protein LOC117829333 [Notolabrus celidotus]
MASPPVSLAKANSIFSLGLFKTLSDEDKTGNIFYSPFSISSALAMVMLGARGNTAAQMSEVLGFGEGDQPQESEEQPMEEEQTQMKTTLPALYQTRSNSRQRQQQRVQPTSKLPKYLRQVFCGSLQCLKPQTDDDSVHGQFAKLLSELNKEDASYALSVANRLYGEQSYQFIKDFLADTKKLYSTELESVDFKTKAEESRVQINSWVEEKTQGKITEVLGQGVLDDKTRLVLVNAIYFKGHWDQKFKEEFTEDAQFRINKNETKPVKMMRQKSEFSYSLIPEFKMKVLEMHYKGKDLSMIIFLPDDIEDDTTGLEKLEEELTHQNFVDWTRPDMMSQGDVEVKLPRFKMEEKYNLKSFLEKMGMSDAFDVSLSDFSGMSQANDLVLSRVVHKAFVEVNEEGTEAAAATSAVLSSRTIKIPVIFTADHPFLFFIKHKPTKQVLFAGRYCSPENQVKESRDFTTDTMASVTPLSKANTTFSLALLKNLGDNDKTGNVFYSPFSISSALAMVMLGAGGNTAAQMSECLKTQECQDEVHTSFGELLSELNKADAPYALSVANRLYGEQSYQFVEDFLGNTKKHYDAELETVDFIKNFEATRVKINSWVESKTQNKIKDVLSQGVVDSMTRLVLVNAIYFKGNWNKQFKESATRDTKFRLNKNETKSVKMMHQKTKFPLTYIPEGCCQILEMPYEGKELSMLIFLPTNIEDDTTGLEKLEKELTYENFVEWTRPDMMDEVELMVGLPRFKMEEKYDLKNVLMSMGMRDPFDMTMSDFSGMSPANDLVLSKVVHKAFIEVNEEGTEAAAATAAVMMLRCALRPAAFIADHPFLFFIRHNPSMSILFAGRYCSPE